MKLSCTRDNLHQALSITSHLTTKNVNLPILQNVLVHAQGGTIRFTSTNLEIGINCTVRGKVEQEGSSTIPSKLFFDYVSLLPSETVSIEGEGDAFRISCGNNNTKINGLDATDFPLVPSVEGAKEYEIAIEPLRQMLSQVLFSVATNESRPELTGVCVTLVPSNGGTELVMASTDSYRLSERKMLLEGQSVSEKLQLIIPARTLSEVNRILSVFKDGVDSPEKLTMLVGENQVAFRYGGVELVSRVIEGVYPDYGQIIPTSFQTEAVIDREDLVRAVKAASLFSKQGLFDVVLRFDADEGCLAVKAADATRGENTVKCPAEFSGQSNEVTVNYRYLLDGLGAMKTTQVRFKMIDAGNPCLVEPVETQGAHLYIVMPIKQ